MSDITINDSRTEAELNETIKNLKSAKSELENKMFIQSTVFDYRILLIFNRTGFPRSANIL